MPEPDPVHLDYQRQLQSNVKYTSMLALLAASIAFGVSHWITEYCCQCLYHLGGAGPRGTRVYSRALDEFQMDMMIETVVIILCSLAFLVTQGLLRPGSATPTRRRALLVAAAAGIFFSLSRWAMSLVLKGADIHIGGPLDFCIAVALAIGLGTVVSFYRWPRGL
jgi:hypothetical protein